MLQELLQAEGLFFRLTFFVGINFFWLPAIHILGGKAQGHKNLFESNWHIFGQIHDTRHIWLTIQRSEFSQVALAKVALGIGFVKRGMARVGHGKESVFTNDVLKLEKTFELSHFACVSVIIKTNKMLTKPIFRKKGCGIVLHVEQLLVSLFLTQFGLLIQWFTW